MNEDNIHEIASTRNTYLGHSPMVFDDKTRVERSRFDRYRLLSVARQIFASEGKKEGLEYPLNFHKTAKCSYIPTGQSVSVKHSKKYGKSHYKGVIVCGRVWTCPVCASKIQERRRVEVAKCMDWAYSNGYKCIMVTLTFPHMAFEKLSELFQIQKYALELLRSGREWVELKKRMGFEGLIRSLELTHGENGWHPHTHEVWVVKNDVDGASLRDEIAERWLSCIQKSKNTNLHQIDAFLRHSVDIVDNARSSDYLLKMDDSKNWGIDRELVKGNSKKGAHPFSFLEHIFQEKTEYIPLWLEYAKAIKGKNQLLWSQGLKKRVGVNELTDEEIAKENEEEAVLLGQLSLSEWRTITRQNAEAEVLSLSERYGWDGVLFWLSRNVKSPSERLLAEAIEAERRMEIKQDDLYWGIE